MRRAFTLLEVMVALTIAGIIALAARAALSAGLDTEERVQIHVARTEGDARFRALLVSALRHMTDAPAGVTPCVVRDTLLAEGGHSHALEFYSRGLSLPAGSGPTLRMELVPSDDGLTILAHDARGVTYMRGTAPGLAGVRIQLRTLSGEWLDRWPRTLQVPAAVAIEFTARDGRPQPTPLFVTVGLEGGA